MRNPLSDPDLNTFIASILEIAHATICTKESQIRSIAQNIFVHLNSTHNTPVDAEIRALLDKLLPKTRALMDRIADEGMPRIIVNPAITETLENLWYAISDVNESIPH